MSRKNPSAAELLVLAPWWVSAFLAVAAYAGFRWVIPAITASSSNVFIKSFGGALPGLAPIAFLFLAALAVVSAMFAARRRGLVDKQTSLESLKSIQWQEFEWLVGEAFRRQGYSVEEGLSRGPDGGIDVILRKSGQTTLVQCKHRKSSAVGVPVVRELFGVMTSEHAHAAMLITTGTFTQETRAFAAGKPIRLIDGDELLTLVQGVQRPGKTVEQAVKAEPKRSTVASAAPSEPRPTAAPPVLSVPAAPTCPKCGAAMVVRTARRGANAGNQFWGCSTYPKCTRSAALLLFTGLLVFTSHRTNAADVGPTAPDQCLFAGKSFLFRWAEKDQYEFTPAGQEDLQRWFDMITVVLHRDVTTNEQLADLANRVLGRYQAAKAIVLGAHSKPRTATEPAEHFAAVVFPGPTETEVAFARVKLVDGVGCVFVYSHREYGEKIGDRVSAWLATTGPATEKNLLSWEAFPHPKEFSSAPPKVEKN